MCVTFLLGGQPFVTLMLLAPPALAGWSVGVLQVKSLVLQRATGFQQRKGWEVRVRLVGIRKK